MLESANNRQVIDPYKTIGCFASGPISLVNSSPFAIAVACNRSYKIYSGELAIKVVSPCFEDRIEAIASYNEYTYIYCAGAVWKMKYHHLVNKWQIKQQPSNSSDCSPCLLLFSSILVLSDSKNIYVINQSKSETVIPEPEHSQNCVSMLTYPMLIKGMIHPVTYINKLLIHSDSKLLLVNPISQKILYEYKQLSERIKSEHHSYIHLISATPLVDIVVVALGNGEMLILNLKKSTIIFTMKQKKTVQAFAFCQQHPYMATADLSGNIILWDLENKVIIYRLESAIQDSPIDHLSFVPGYELLTAISSQANTLRQFRINREDAHTLTLYRQRVGTKTPIHKIFTHNNNQISYSTDQSTGFTSLYSHCNNYVLPYKILDSALPYHIVSHHYKVQVFKDRSLYCSHSLQQDIICAKVSMSQKYIIAATRTKIVKLSINKKIDQLKSKLNNKASSLAQCSLVCEWPISHQIKQLELYNQTYIYAFASNHKSINVYDFYQPLLVSTIEISLCGQAIKNLTGNLLAFENAGAIEVWGMKSMVCGRKFQGYGKELKNLVSCFAFTSDNRFLLSALTDCRLLVWSMLDNCLYKQLKLQKCIQFMCFTSDNGYLLSVGQGQQEICIWHNYIGRVTSQLNTETQIKFVTQIKKVQSDYRKVLQGNSNGFVVKQEEHPGYSNSNAAFERVLTDVPDAEDQVPFYNFEQNNKWVPLVFYDEIRSRNGLGGERQKGDNFSVPFFLDFQNLDEQKDKIQQQIRKEMLDKRKHDQRNRDALLQNDNNEIDLNEQSAEGDYLRNYRMLTGLSIAEVDYQLRKFMLVPVNNQLILRMFLNVLKNQQNSENCLQLHVLILRALQIMGSDILSEQTRDVVNELGKRIDFTYSELFELMNRCLAIIENRG